MSQYQLTHSGPDANEAPASSPAPLSSSSTQLASLEATQLPSQVVKLTLEQMQEQLKLQQQLLLDHQREFSTHAHTAASSGYISQGFTQGFFLGQLSVILVIGIFIKFFVFADSSSVSTTVPKDAAGVIVKRNKNKDKDADEPEENTRARTVSTILEKTYYDVETHASESLDWFNVLVAQAIAHLRLEALLSDNIFHSLNEFLAKSDFPDYLDKVRITEIDIGDDFPILSNCRISHTHDDSGRLEAKIDVDLSDTLTLGIETRLLLNRPKPVTAALPIQLSVSLVRFSGCLTVSLDSTEGNEDNHSGTALMFSFSPDYRLEFSIKSLIGSRAKLQDVPKISALIESRLRYWFAQRCVEPRYQVIKIPSLWPRTETTKEQKSE